MKAELGTKSPIDGFSSLQRLWFTYVYICLRIVSVVAFGFLQNQRTSMIMMYGKEFCIRDYKVIHVIGCCRWTLHAF